MRSDYYINGFEIGKLKENQRLNAVLRKLMSEPLKEGYFWERKYPNTFDMRPKAYDYDESILDVLFSSGIHLLLQDYVASDMLLSHVQIRRSLPGPSYMDWHRDSYQYDSTIVGNIPPTHKVIFYPKLDHDPEPKLKLAAKSHRRAFETKKEDLLSISSANIETYSSSDDEFILFDTSIMHGVIPDKHPEGSIRIIYSFIRYPQIHDIGVADKASIHVEQAHAYALRKNGIRKNIT